MTDYNKKISARNIRVGEVRFSFVNVFAPRENEDGTPANTASASSSPSRTRPR